MRKAFIFLTFLSFFFIPFSVFGASLAWDYDEYHDQTDGFTVHFTDGTEENIYVSRSCL